MNYSFVFVVSASIAVLGSAATDRIARHHQTNRPASAPLPTRRRWNRFALTHRRARRELLLLIKRPAASLDKMKIVELDELIDRLQHGDPAVHQPGVARRELSGPEVNDERAYAIEIPPRLR
jgi:thioesterase domain-containing protein